MTYRSLKAGVTGLLATVVSRGYSGLMRYADSDASQSSPGAGLADKSGAPQSRAGQGCDAEDNAWYTERARPIVNESDIALSTVIRCVNPKTLG